jgi:hypothetical protein
MSLICSTSCGDAPNLLASYYDCEAEKTRQFGASKFILEKCDNVWTDVLDTTEWTTKITAGDVAVSPPGVLTIGEPTIENITVDGCESTRLGRMIFPVTFETYFVESDLSDWAYWRNLLRNHNFYRMMILDCEEIFRVESNWAVEIAAGSPATVAGEVPGYKFNITSAPHEIEGDARKTKWKIEFEIITRDVLGMAYIPGVPALL